MIKYSSLNQAKIIKKENDKKAWQKKNNKLYLISSKLSGKNISKEIKKSLTKEKQ